MFHWARNHSLLHERARPPSRSIVLEKHGKGINDFRQDARWVEAGLQSGEEFRSPLQTENAVKKKNSVTETALSRPPQRIPGVHYLPIRRHSQDQRDVQQSQRRVQGAMIGQDLSRDRGRDNWCVPRIIENTNPRNSP